MSIPQSNSQSQRKVLYCINYAQQLDMTCSREFGLKSPLRSTFRRLECQRTGKTLPAPVQVHSFGTEPADRVHSQNKRTRYSRSFLTKITI